MGLYHPHQNWPFPLTSQQQHPEKPFLRLLGPLCLLADLPALTSHFYFSMLRPILSLSLGLTRRGTLTRSPCVATGQGRWLGSAWRRRSLHITSHFEAETADTTSKESKNPHPRNTAATSTPPPNGAPDAEVSGEATTSKIPARVPKAKKSKAAKKLKGEGKVKQGKKSGKSRINKEQEGAMGLDITDSRREAGPAAPQANMGRAKKPSLKMLEYASDLEKFQNLADELTTNCGTLETITLNDIDEGRPSGEGPYSAEEIERAIQYLQSGFTMAQLKTYYISHHGGTQVAPPLSSNLRKAEVVELIIARLWRMRRSKEELISAIRQRRVLATETLHVTPTLVKLLRFKNVPANLALKTLCQITPDESAGTVTLEGPSRPVELARGALRRIEQCLSSETLELPAGKGGLSASRRPTEAALDYVGRACQTVVVFEEPGTFRITAITKQDLLATKRLLIHHFWTNTTARFLLGVPPVESDDTPALILAPIVSPPVLGGLVCHPPLSRLQRIQPINRLHPMDDLEEALALHPIDRTTRKLLGDQPDTETGLGQLYQTWMERYHELRTHYPGLGIRLAVRFGQVGTCPADRLNESNFFAAALHSAAVEGEGALSIDQLLTSRLFQNEGVEENKGGGESAAADGTYVVNAGNFPVRALFQLGDRVAPETRVVARWTALSHGSHHGSATGSPPSPLPRAVQLEAILQPSTNPTDLAGPTPLVSLRQIVDHNIAHLLLPDHPFDLTLEAHYEVQVPAGTPLFESVAETVRHTQISLQPDEPIQVHAVPFGMEATFPCHSINASPASSSSSSSSSATTTTTTATAIEKITDSYFLTALYGEVTRNSEHGKLPITCQTRTDIFTGHVQDHLTGIFLTTRSAVPTADAVPQGDEVEAVSPVGTPFTETQGVAEWAQFVLDNVRLIKQEASASLQHSGDE
ncbi:hypothetical protein IWQ60_005777 [Tieghemiomyces parasiticus]|uniref:SLS1 N-terminal domain-containing protein n=1 Tax=Tieghemiomyces parasiticus TaxID=78921 RepID=A0A9W8ADE4_9FUNG|nr:hypothetical protein IWQ60_005777 [Tieghemiomyces parasiticus]